MSFLPKVITGASELDRHLAPITKALNDLHLAHGVEQVFDVNGKLSKSQTKVLPAIVIDVTFASGTTDTQIQHNLGRVPTSYEVLRLSAAAIVYDGTVTPDKTFITLQASAPVTARIRIR